MLNHTIISDESFLSDQAIQHGMGQVFTSLAKKTTIPSGAQWIVYFLPLILKTFLLLQREISDVFSKPKRHIIQRPRSWKAYLYFQTYELKIEL